MNQFIQKIKEYLFGYLWMFYSNVKSVIPGRIVFLTFQGKYTCNPKYICEKIHEISPKLELIWVTFDDGNTFPDYVQTVKLGSHRYYEAVYTAQILIENAFVLVKRPWRKKNGQIHIQTMHGSLGLKRIDPESGRSRKRNEKGFKSAEDTDYIISNSDFEDEVYRTSFWQQTPILKFGHARNDLFFSDEETKKQIRHKIRSAYGLDDDVKLCLYAPTYMRSDSNEYEKLNFDKLRSTLSEKFGGTWYILFRCHPKDKGKCHGDFSSFIFDGNIWDDIHELITAIDFGITDYSSWICDYVLTKNPGALFVPDIDDYSHVTGFYYPLSETPFLIGKTNDDLFSKILEFDDNQYKEKVSLFVNKKGCIDDGHASEKAAGFVSELMNQ